MRPCSQQQTNRLQHTVPAVLNREGTTFRPPLAVGAVARQHRWSRWWQYLSFSRAGAELLFQIFADRYERASLLVTSNLPFSEWQQVFQGERMTAALLDRLTHRCHIFEMNGESYRFRESVKKAKKKAH